MAKKTQVIIVGIEVDEEDFSEVIDQVRGIRKAWSFWDEILEGSDLKDIQAWTNAIDEIFEAYQSSED